MISPGDLVIVTDAGGREWAAIAETSVIQGRDMPVVTVYFQGQGAIPWPAEYVRLVDPSVLASLDGADHSPIDEPDGPVGQVELFDLTAEQGVLNPSELDLDRSVAVGEVDPLPVHQQPHAATVAQSFEEV